MAIQRPDIYEHNNPNNAIVDSDGVRGGFRTKVATVTDLYLLSVKEDQLKEYATTIWVEDENKFYVLIDITKISNSQGWNGGLISNVTPVSNPDYEIINPTVFSTIGTYAGGNQKVVGDNSFSDPFVFIHNGNTWSKFDQIVRPTSIDLTTKKRLDVIVLTPLGEVLLLEGVAVNISDSAAQALSPAVDPTYYVYAYISWSGTPSVVPPTEITKTSDILINDGAKNGGGIPYANTSQVDLKLNKNEKGQPSGVAPLNASGKIDNVFLPSSINEILSGTYVNSTTFKDLANVTYTPASNKIYVDVNTNITYRWSGVIYVAIGSSLALGETSESAYRGDHGLIAYDHSQLENSNPHGTTASQVGAYTTGQVDTLLGEVVRTAFTGTSIVAQNNQILIVTNDATISNPMTVGGKGYYEVVVRSGVATVGSVEYTAGLTIKRTFNGTWKSELYLTKEKNDLLYQLILTYTNFGTFISNAIGKNVLVDADQFSIVDSISGLASKFSWLKMKEYFATVFQTKTQLITTATTATNGSKYIASGTFTVADFTGVQGNWYEVFVRNGVITIDGKAYKSSVTIKRIFDTTWKTYVYKEQKEIKISTGVSGTYAIDPNISDEFALTLTGNTTLNFVNFSSQFSEVVSGDVVGNFGVTYTVGTKINGAYIGSASLNTFVVKQTNGIISLSWTNYL